jgi:hypothetical protein
VWEPVKDEALIEKERRKRSRGIRRVAGFT